MHMVITTEARSALEDLIDLSARTRALRHEHDHPHEAERFQSLIAEHKELSGRRDAAAEVVEGLRVRIRDLGSEVERRRETIRRKTAELNDGTGLTSRDLVNLQTEIDSQETAVAGLEDSELEVLEEQETAEAQLAGIEQSLATVTEAGRTTQQAIKDRKAELAAEIEELENAQGARKELVPAQVLSGFEANLAAGGPGAAILTGPHCLACGQEISGVTWQGMLADEVNTTYQCEECEAVLLRRS